MPMKSILQKEVSPMGEEPFLNPAAGSLDAAEHINWKG